MKKHVKNLFLISIISVIIFSIPATTDARLGICHFYGYVKDVNTGEPISGVYVRLYKGSFIWDSDYTDSNGRYDVYTDPVFSNTYVTLKFTKSDYLSKTLSKIAKPGYNIIVNVNLYPTTAKVTGVVGYDTGKPGRVAGEDFTITARRQSDNMLVGTTTTDHWGNYELAVSLTYATTIKIYASNPHLDDFGWSDSYLLKTVYLSPGQSTTASKTFAKYPDDNLEFNAHIYLHSLAWAFKYKVFFDLEIHYYLAHYTDPNTVPPSDPNSEYLMYIDKLTVSIKNPENIPDPNTIACFSLAFYTDWPINDGIKFRTCYNFKQVYMYGYYDHNVQDYYGFTNGMYEWLFGETTALDGGNLNDETWRGYTTSWPALDTISIYAFWFPGVFYL